MSVATPEALSCQELVELVTDYLEDAMSPSEAARFEHHLSGCAKCGAYLGQMRQTIRLVGRLDPERLGTEAEAVLREAFAGWKRG
jgi:anti-sigma factor RsiW